MSSKVVMNSWICCSPIMSSLFENNGVVSSGLTVKGLYVESMESSSDEIGEGGSYVDSSAGSSRLDRSL